MKVLKSHTTIYNFTFKTDVREKEANTFYTVCIIIFNVVVSTVGGQNREKLVWIAAASQVLALLLLCYLHLFIPQLSECLFTLEQSRCS